jgi:hypothetical protein
LKLRQMGTLGVHVHMNGVLPWLVQWTCRAGTIDFCPALAALVSHVQNIIFLTAHTLFHFISPHRPATSMQAVVLGRLSMCLWADPSITLAFFPAETTTVSHGVLVYTSFMVQCVYICGVFDLSRGGMLVRQGDGSH